MILFYGKQTLLVDRQGNYPKIKHSAFFLQNNWLKTLFMEKCIYICMQFFNEIYQMKYKYILLGFGLGMSLLFNTSVKAQNANPHIQAMKFNEPDTNKMEDRLKGAVEDVSKRTLYSSTYKKGSKFMARYSTVMINYPDANGNLQPVDLTLHSDAQGWVADKQPNPCYLHLDRSTTVTLGGGKEITFNKNASINDMPLDQNIVSINGSVVKFNLSQGIHKELEFIPGGIETNYIFDSPLEGGGINVKEEVVLPDGCVFQKDSIHGKMQPGGGWAGDYLLKSADGKQVLAKLQAAECYDSKKHWCLANYSIQKKDGKNILVTSIPSNWLSTAVYPVTLDPRITGLTATWGGKSTNSCLYPHFTVDSILVKIPAKITITFFTIDYAYTALGTVPKSDGVIYISTPCAKSDTFGCSVGDSAKISGICYLVPGSDFHCPYTSCYTPSCLPQSFWLDVGLSRLKGAGCDTDFIYYNAYAGYPYVFSAYVEGYTDSILNNSTSVSYNPTKQCSNLCNITMNATLQFGVPPYTVSHPWASRDTVVGSYNNLTCTSQGVVQMQLKVPGCPYNCGNIKTIKIPPPTVVDFCGDTAVKPDSVTYTIDPVPVVSYIPTDTSVCSGLPVRLTLKSCVPGTTFTWIGTDNASGTSDTALTDQTHDTGNAPMIVTYSIVGSANGCNSDTIKTKAKINPFPIVNVTGADTLILGNSERLVATGGGTYSWSPAAGLSCTNCPNPVATPTITTKYSVTVTDSGGCDVIMPFTIFVLDENVIIPNVITPNGDNINDYFTITNLQDYPNSKLTIFDRWGKQVYTSNNYQNNWNGSGQSAGVYDYVLVLPTGKKYEGFVQIIK